MGRCAGGYGSPNGDLERKISLCIGFGKLSERLSARGEDWEIMQKSQWRRKDNVSRNLHLIPEEGGSAISIKGDPDL